MKRCDYTVARMWNLIHKGRKLPRKMKKWFDNTEIFEIVDRAVLDSVKSYMHDEIIFKPDLIFPISSNHGPIFNITQVEYNSLDNMRFDIMAREIAEFNDKRMEEFLVKEIEDASK